MGHRKTLLATSEIYHVFNRGVEKRPIFLNRRNYLRFIELANYYRFANAPIKFSFLKRMSPVRRRELFDKLEGEAKLLVEIFAFCLMPNHIHFLLRQLIDGGVSKFIAKMTNSYGHYFNINNNRIGHLFQGNFGAVRIETDEQLVHVSRYIHLNPVSSYIIDIEHLENYDYSSYPQYVGKRTGFCNTTEVLSLFDSVNTYKAFVSDQADYARELENIKHLTLEAEK